MKKTDLASKTAERIKKKMESGASDIPTPPKHAGGRPKAEKTNKEKIVIYLPEDDYTTFKEIAQTENQSMSNLCRTLITEYIKNKQNNS